MKYFRNAWLLIAILGINSVAALQETDQQAIQDVIVEYTIAWNSHAGKGFADGFTEDADFVNIFGMHFSGKAEIEYRHEQILQTFFKGSNLEILSSQLREVQPGLVIALVRWRLTGYRNPRQENAPSEVREGIFTQVFINQDNNWAITASQNTLAP